MQLKKIILPLAIVIIIAIFLGLSLNWRNIFKSPTAEERYKALVEEKFVISAYSTDFEIDDVTKEKLRKKLENSKASALNSDKATQGQGWYGLFFVQSFINDYPKAEFALQKAIEFDPSSFQYYGDLADLYNFYLKDKNKAIEYYEKAINPPVPIAIEFDSGSKAYLFINLSGIYAADFNDLNKAIDTLENGLDRLGNNYDILIQLARYYRQAGDKTQALANYKKAQQVLPERKDLIQAEIEEMKVGN